MHREALDLLMAEVNKALHGKSCKFLCVLLKEHTVNVCRFWYEDEGLQHLYILKDINQETDHGSENVEANGVGQEERT